MTNENYDIAGAAAEVIANIDTGQVVTRYLHPTTGEALTEVSLDPETAREYARSLTLASFIAEDRK